MKACLIIFILLNSVFAVAEAKKVAVVKILRGEVSVLTLGKTTPLKVDDWVEDGATVKTAEKSFVKLIFVDKSQMNVGPNSEMNIEKFADNDSGVIGLVKGQIRSQVTKDYLKMKDKDKSKLFIKTPNAVMGIRGTDFLITTQGQKTLAVLFEGSVVFNRTDSRDITDSSRLEAIVNQGVRMAPGEFSVVEQNRNLPTIPARLNIQQRENLEKNETFDSRNPSSGNEEAKKSVVPNGLSGQVVSNDGNTLKSEVSQVAGTAVETSKSASADAAGFIKGDAVKPANGSFVHVESGLIIPPGSDSVFDANSDTFIPGPDSGKAGSDGSYIPTAGTEITSSGQILVTVKDETGKAMIVEKAAPSVVKTDAPKASGGVIDASNGGRTTTASAQVNVFNPGGMKASTEPAPVGSPVNVNQAAQQFQDTGARMRSIRVNN